MESTGPEFGGLYSRLESLTSEKTHLELRTAMAFTEHGGELYPFTPMEIEGTFELEGIYSGSTVIEFEGREHTCYILKQEDGLVYVPIGCCSVEIDLPPVV